ncbi:MAG: RecQ family ATP-dependent DNA helicase [Syntrophobacteraceae bacterium]
MEHRLLCILKHAIGCRQSRTHQNMDASNFLSKCLLLDLEVRGDLIFRIGAVRGDATFERRGKFNVEKALLELDSFSADAEYVLGHNIADHDLPILYRNLPDLRLLEKTVVDTLFLSPLAFPENPYHRLVKNYKLVRESLNDPVADARLAGSVFRDQWESFDAVNKRGSGRVLSVYRFCFERCNSSDLKSCKGMVAVLDALEVERISTSLAVDILTETLDKCVCATALNGIAESLDSRTDLLAALPYCVAWLRVAGANSVLPPWVCHRLPIVSEILRQLREVPCANSECSYCRIVHDPQTQLKRCFGFAAFRRDAKVREGDPGFQEEIVRYGMGDRPHLAILPTGGGKSICYQLPALVRHFRRGALTIVISPLQALMKDQVDNLISRTGIASAAALYGLLTPPERGEVLERVRLGDIAILYVAPEQFRNVSFRKTVSQREIGCWVFDEAHCLSKWGHDFRPDYLYAGRFIREFAAEQRVPPPPVACFTATAKQDVKEEIIEFFKNELGQELAVFEGGIERENLHFEVQMVNKAEKFERIHSILTERLPDGSGSAVIYVSTRRASEEAAQYLTAQEWPAAAYHAGLAAPEKRAVQESFIAGEIRVICATNAFGMGIDKEDIRLVIHADIPGSLENYLQEAGRAGRDLQDAECVLLYDEQDIETQFKLQGLSELSRQDIARLLRSLRRAKRNKAGEVVITSGELLRDDEAKAGADFGDPQADTKVKAGVSWLERSGFLERDRNNTRVFQGKPLVKSLDEAKARIARLNLSTDQQNRWLAVLQELMNAEPDEGLSADQLAELPQLRSTVNEGLQRAGRAQGSSLEVLRILHSMAEAGLVKQGIMLSAFVRHKVKNHSELIFERVCALEEAMLKVMMESDPDAASEGWLDLSLRKLNQRLVDNGFEDSNPAVLLNLLKSLSMDGRGLAGRRGSLDLRSTWQDHYRVKLHRDWDALVETARRRRMVAKTALEAIMMRVPANAPVSAEVLVSFSSDEIAQALRQNIYLAGQIKDTPAAIDRALMYLHEQKAIILQQGLAVFRQAMTIRIKPEMKNRRYSIGDYEPLSRHYRERILQIHIMNEYAKLGMEKIRQALELVLAYFTMDKVSFLRRFFPGRMELIERATGRESYRRIVENLENRAQIEIVTAPEETNMLVLAGPGSGKTRVVVHRCAYLLRVMRVPARSILVLCYNRNAAIALRRRLHELVGADARGVMVQTYHGLAMRLTGASFADLGERAAGGETPNFDRLIPEAIRLLQGKKEILGIERDELRDRLLSGYRHILVDEYQDIDEEQYALISAIAGRTEQDRESKLTILAVGDDDQNIYTFRGANVKFIRQFSEDYAAKTHYLVENYRSTANIIAASNSLIRHNEDRMKRDREISIDSKRAGEKPGGAWENRDAVGRGCVQVIAVRAEYEQTSALLSELHRLRDLDPDLRWSDCAVLAPTREALSPIRSLCEHNNIPVTLSFNKGKTPSLNRIREILLFLDELKMHRDELKRASQLQESLGRLAIGRDENPWWQLLRDIVTSWLEETADAELPVSQAIEFIFESLAEQRREQSIGRGLFLGTVHGAKGMEFPHVFILDGGWSAGRTAKEREEERRVFYVAMTRSGRTLCIFQREDGRNPHLKLIDERAVLRRPGQTGEAVPEEILRQRFELIGMQEMFISFAGYWPPGSAIHRRLEALQPGSILTAAKKGGRVELLNPRGAPVAALSQSGAKTWLPQLDSIKCIRVVAMLRRHSRDSSGEYRAQCRSESWEVPWIEIVRNDLRPHRQ